jgi:pimeloyl-ACP methyl ester carboxylesterase
LRGSSSFVLIAAALLSASPAAAEDIVLDTGRGRLAGTLERPGGAKPRVCALIVAGSGPTDRDGNQQGMRNDSLKQLAQGLALRGICTLRYDKRGVNGSAEAFVERDLRFDTYVADATAWIARLRRVGGAPRVAAVGHSEGALVALLAARHAQANAVVSIAGAGRPAAELIREQLQQLPAVSRRRGEFILNELVAGRLVSEVPPDFGMMFRPSVQPYLMSWTGYNPAEEIRTFSAPVMILQGTADLQVSVGDARILAAANPRATLSLIPDMNHVLKPSKTAEEQRAAYTDPAVAIDARAVDAIAGFLLNLP